MGRSVCGYVYLIRMKKIYKIGQCKSWKSRRKGYSGMPYRVHLEVLLKTLCMPKLEQELHKRYSEKRLCGEWFALTPEDVEEIRNHPLRVENSPYGFVEE